MRRDQKQVKEIGNMGGGSRMKGSRITEGITEEQIYLFHEGTNYKSYHMLGAHRMELDSQSGVRFSVWAPNANWVSVVGDFNNWNISANLMMRKDDSGIWELFIPGVETGQLYKYAVGSSSGEVLYKSDPYAYYCELRPNTASIVYDIDGFAWTDAPWIKRRNEKLPVDKPLLIYEAHLGSWKQNEDGSFKNYRELATELIDYVVDMGYTHIELMPVMEHPFDGSWGYQVTGYYAVTSRYGTPKDFMYFVDYCHQKGIGVILDWVPGHFPKDAHGLAKFDGTSIYEHPDPRRGEHPQWGTLIFDYGRHEVQSFLISNAIFWLEHYHVDGFRVDAVTSILFLDFGREDWLPNQYGGNENLEAAAFLKRLNETVFSEYPSTLMIAEDSSQWPLVTAPTSSGGLGFLYKWNMGWMNDTLRYTSMDPLYRKWNHNLLTFSLTYAFSENYILPLSHDEVVHGKRSLLNKMPGEYHQKFAGLRSLLGYMMAHPGKKLTFMGGEFGQFIEWRYDSGLDWLLLDYEMHQKIKDYVKALNHFYQEQPALWEDDNGWSGFEWICPDDNNQSVLAFLRKSRSMKDYLLVVVNFTPVERPDYLIGVPKEKGFLEIFNSDEACYGGNGYSDSSPLKTEKIPSHGYEQSIRLKLPPLSVVFYKPVKQAGRSTKVKK
ncbi:MAG: 1,4-alpha-glucan branching enzyme [Firmicutes bacterium]|nr:1,4-alpha-glucan branching enzyme [Bacillota bacterium]